MPRQTDRERVDRTLLDNSVERVINTTIGLLVTMPKRSKQVEEELDTNVHDWKELKPVTVALFNEARNRALQRVRTDLILLNSLKHDAGADLGEGRLVQVTDHQAEVVSRLLRQVAKDEPEHWGTTADEIREILRRIAA